MLVQALAKYADRYLSEQLEDAAWETKPVPWQIEISKQGLFLNVTPRMTEETRGKKTVNVPQKLSVARSPVNRNSGHHPLLAADDIAYVLGVGPWTPEKPGEPEKAENHFAAFKSLIGKAAEETRDEALAACARFYDSPAEIEKARNAMAEAKAGALVALSVGGPLVERGAVQEYWRNHYDAAFAKRLKGSLGECLISGRYGPIAPTHEKIKGTSSLGGQAAGVSLMSFDKEAFRSYGWDQNENSPVSPGRALAYVLAFNDLLQSGESSRKGNGVRRDRAGVGFISWLSSPEDFDFWNCVDPPSTDQVKALLAIDPKSDPNPNYFYLAGVTGNGGRLRVVYWVDRSLAEIKSNLRNWHEQLQVAYPWPDPDPVKMWQLYYALDSDGEPEKHDTIALLRRAVEGHAQRLGYKMLAKALTRLRHPGGSKNTKNPQAKEDPWSITRWRVPMGLIRLCVNDITNSEGKGAIEMTEGLNETCTEPAYVCGRLIAEYEGLQRAASESELNSTILDRFFALASTYPAVAFPKIGTLAQKHLKKLRRDKPGAANAIDRRIGELHGLLNCKDGFPAKLGLTGQGMFMIGYYHQKAWSVAQAASRKQAIESNEKTTEVLKEQE